MSQREQGGKFVLLKGKKGISGAVTFQDSGDTATKTAHGLANGDKVSYSVITTTTGIVINTEYFVVGATANTYQHSATRGGAVLTLTTDGTGTLDDIYQIFGGLRSKSITVNSEEIDVTNHDSDEWKTLLNGAGIRSAALSGELVNVDTDSVLKYIRSQMLQNLVVDLQIVVSEFGSKFQGSFKVTELGTQGDYNAESTVSISASSSGAVAYTHVAA